jgi:predicted nucleic acid-binding protein
MRLVLDANVAAKWFSNEELTDKAVKVRDEFLDGKIDLCAPEHLLCEVGNSVWKNKSLDTDDSIKAVESLLVMTIDLVRLDSKAAGQAMNLARDLGITYYDAVYAHVSTMLGIPLLTADKVLFETAKILYILEIMNGALEVLFESEVHASIALNLSEQISY